ncbi:MAG: hypothetical protein LLF75_12700 [Eubacteriales bacterium]|nr:hypothetical protein [Eubacteriales bacterium]
MKEERIGLLPLYLKLYDDTVPSMRPRVERFCETIASSLKQQGLLIETAPICRIEPEFRAAIANFEANGVAAIVTLHLAYSPSLESVEALAGTKLPVILLDTTEDFAFDHTVDADEILFNHGIHGVQDLCNLLSRHHKDYEIFAGHYQKSDVLARTARACRGAIMAKRMRASRVGLVGGPFAGMGDFCVPFDDLSREIGVEVVPYDEREGARRISAVTQEELDAEWKADQTLFMVEPCVTRAIYDRTARVSIALRKWREEQRLSALTVNFLATKDSNPALPVMPFTECSRSMMDGVGYAGEGDVLTAALVGALLSAFPDTTFSEMFCPDWKGNSIFLSHMGEFNYRVCAGKPRLTEKDFPFTNAENPTVAYGTFRKGKAAYVNLAPGGNGKYTLICTQGEVLPVRGKNQMRQSVNGWFRPDGTVANYLERFSRLGGTHHSALVYGECIDELAMFARCMGFTFAAL